MTPDAPPPHGEISAVTPSLLHADTAVVSFQAQKDGKLRMRCSSFRDEVAVIHPGEVAEVAWGPQGVELRIVPGLRRMGDLVAAIVRAEDCYDGDPALAARLRAQADAMAAKLG